MVQQAVFTQSPAFALPFALASNTTIQITNYVSVTGGTMPANPTITATLSAGGTTFLTLSSPTYSSGAGTLVWSGALSSNVNLGAGQAISLTVSNAQTNVQFSISYDSVACPSKIILPTASIIAVPSLGVYNAPYPGGAPVASSYATTPCYVRVTVTDPFGAYDLAGAGLVIDGPGTAGDVAASLTDANVVSSNAWSKTYEYPWQTIALPGTYTIAVTANEGTEGITASATNTESLYSTVIGDFCWIDANANGQQDVGETGLVGVVVRLYDTNNAVVATTTSSVSGAYAFVGVAPGTYTVGFTPPAGYLFTTSGVGNAATDSNPLSGTNRTAAVTVGSGQTDNTIDAGFYQMASLAGAVLLDVNGNGVADANDTNGIAGVTVQLLNAASNLVATTTTGASGAYGFTNLTPGAYTVVQALPVGYTNTLDTAAPNDLRIPATLTSGQVSTGNLFYDTQYASVSGAVRMDVNGNGVVDAGDTNGIAGVTVQLLDATNGVVAATTTAADGSYAFANVRPGSYTVRETDLPGWYSTLDAAAPNDNLIPVTLTSGQASAGNNFYDTAYASVSGAVLVDANGNGVADTGDTNGIAGVTVQLLNAASNVVATTTTTAAGAYTFTNLVLGNYTVVQALPAGYTNTLDTAAPNDLRIPFAVTIGQASTGNNFYDTAFVAIGDFTWVDTNGNGIQDGGETGLVGVVVRLYNTNNTVIAATTSSVAGAYTFANLMPGTYTVGFTPPSGYLFTTSNVGSDATDSDPLPGTNVTAALTLTSGQTNNNVDAGFYQAASLAGAVLLDVNGNGVADAGDTNGIAGVVVTLLDAASNVVATTTTSAAGAYGFTNLTPGAYTVVQALPAGYTNTLDTAAPNDLRIPVTLASGQASAGNTFYDTVSLAAAWTKILYLSGPTQALDRIDPVAMAGTTTVQTVVLSNGFNGYMTIGAASVSTGITTNVTSTTSITCVVPHTIPAAGTNRLLVVGVSVNRSAAGGTDGDITNVFYGAAGLTCIGQTTNSDQIVALWALKNPPPGTTNVVVVYNSAPQQYSDVGAVTFTNVNQANPYGLCFTNGGVTGNPSLTLTSAVGEVVIDTVSLQTAPLSAPGTGQQQLWNLQSPNSGGYNAGGGSIKTGAASVAMSWTTTNGTTVWAMEAVSLRPAPYSIPGNAVTFTQTPAFAQSFSLPANGLIQITNYVTVVSGTMPANPSIVATLAYGGTTLLTLSNPVYNASSSNLAWSGVLPGVVTIPSGQALTLTIASQQTGVTFRVNYDSATSPSKILLPTISIIHVASLAVYDAAYPGGSIVTNLPCGSNGYIRVTATDPFGAYDVSDVRLAIDGPGTNGDLAVTLTDAQAVASNAWSKTYQYPWQNSSIAGAFVIVATADEGTEGIVATNTTTITRYDLRTAAIAGNVFVDVNGNGLKEGADTNSLAGVTVTLLDATNGVVAVTTTVANGSYAFTNLAAGAYTVRETDPTGYLNTGNRDGALTNHILAVTLAIGGTSSGNFFLETVPTFISGGVYVDVNGNGIVDAGDTNGIAGVTVQLLNATNGVVSTTTTAATGAYNFTNLTPGVYTIKETDLANYLSTTQTGGGTNNLIGIVLTSGTPATGNNFYDTALASVGDFVWVDLNGNGVQDAGEPGLSNVTVRLLNTATNVLQTTLTSTNGAYAFINLAPAAYLLQFVAPSGFVFTTVHAGTNTAVDSDALPTNGVTMPFTLTSGQADMTRDAGLYVPARLYGYDFTDNNGNRVHDAGDAPVTNMLVMIWTNGVEVASTRTDTNGYYVFTGLVPGTYDIRFLCHTNALEAVPTNGPALTNPERTRAIGTTNDNAYIDCTLISGLGVVTAGEPQNAGFIAGVPTAAAVLIRAYATADGVVVEFETIDETGDNDMVLYLFQNGQWVEVGRQPSVGDGNNFYQFIVPGLAAGSVCDLMVLDDAGQQHTTYGLTVGNFAADLVLMTRQSLTLQWASIPNRTYIIYWTDHLGGDWTSIKSLKASLTKTFVTVAIDPAKPAGFFKIVMQP